jgi:hypothetical protein
MKHTKASFCYYLLLLLLLLLLLFVVVVVYFVWCDLVGWLVLQLNRAYNAFFLSFFFSRPARSNYNSSDWYQFPLLNMYE